jgi:hypothetical protein
MPAFEALAAIMTVTDWKKFVKGVWDVVSSLYNLVIDAAWPGDPACRG